MTCRGLLFELNQHKDDPYDIAFEYWNHWAYSHPIIDGKPWPGPCERCQ